MRTVVAMLLLTCVALVPAVDDLNVQLEAAVKGFEDQVDKDFVPVAKSLNGWRGPGRLAGMHQPVSFRWRSRSTAGEDGGRPSR